MVSNGQERATRGTKKARGGNKGEKGYIAPTSINLGQQKFTRVNKGHQRLLKGNKWQ